MALAALRAEVSRPQRWTATSGYIALMIRITMEIDVSAAVMNGDRLQISILVVAPANLSRKRPVVVLAGLPGGGYTKEYFDLPIEGYSQAEFHADHGMVFVACDHLAVGASGLPASPISVEQVASANAFAIRQTVALLASGDLSGQLDPVEIQGVFGMGQSLGGFYLTIQEAISPLFDGVALLGWSGMQTQAPWKEGTDMAAAIVEGTSAANNPRRSYFHLPDVPEWIVDLDLTRSAGHVGSDAAWGAQHYPGGPALSTTRHPLASGVVAAEASELSVPVLIACGEVDVVPEPLLEPAVYRSSRDVTTIVVDGMAHMHNFASTRTFLWRRIGHWAESIAQATA